MTKIISKTPKSSKVTTTLKSVLLQIQFQQYLPLFQRNDIDFTTFLTLNEQTLKTIGIKNDSHRKTLLKHIRKLQQILTNMSLETFDDDLIKVPIDEHNLAILTPITEEEEPGFPAVSETSDGVNDFNQINSEETETIVENKIPQIIEPTQDELPTNETQPNSSSRSEEDDFTPTSRSRKHYSTDNEDLLAIRRQRGAVVRDINWRLSMPVTNNELPSYYNKLPSYYDIDELDIKTCDEELPPYSCSVHKSGYVCKKNEFSSKGYRSRDRSWKRLYLYLWGTLLRIYKSEPVDLNRVTPISEYSMQNVQIGLAKDYAKRNNVIRVRISTGSQFLIQVQDHRECVEWIEKLQSSANISTTIDEREMPMFITLPMRRRRVGTEIPSSSSLSSINSVVNYDGSIPIINNSSIPISASGLTFQQFNDMARELQQVQITEALPQQQLLW